MTEMPYVHQTADLSAPVRYAYGPDSFAQPGVPRGTIVEHEWNAPLSRNGDTTSDSFSETAATT
jgi:hypothetical protein